MPGHWERAELPLDLARRLGELGLVGDGIRGYGCPSMSAVARPNGRHRSRVSRRPP
ncbi:MAG TPA: hypothetical protein VMU39_02485 [Solirubrobacteraceae bacterium]|nr:hypothetical protein [Solirubrobacteraceae bacterium]